jgi:hypothetical protein
MTSSPAATIEADLHCSICAYNLKGLSPDTNCPECGQAISRTFTHDLRSADPAWLRQQARNLPLLCALFLLNVHSADGNSIAQYWGLGWVGPSIGVAIAIVAAFACFRLAIPDPKAGVADSDLDGTYRRGIRFSALGMAALTVLVMGLTLWWTLGRSGMVLLLIATPVFIAVTNLLALLFVARLAQRSKDRLLRRHADVVRYTFPLLPLLDFLLLFMGGPFGDEARSLYYATLYWIRPAALCATVLLVGRVFEKLKAAAAVAEGAPAQTASVG